MAREQGGRAVGEVDGAGTAEIGDQNAPVTSPATTIATTTVAVNGTRRATPTTRRPPRAHASRRGDPAASSGAVATDIVRSLTLCNHD